MRSAYGEKLRVPGIPNSGRIHDHIYRGFWHPSMKTLIDGFPAQMKSTPDLATLDLLGKPLHSAGTLGIFSPSTFVLFSAGRLLHLIEHPLSPP
jgi:hypothetical protein